MNKDALRPPFWTHKGWTITLGTTGNFIATGPENNTLRASSLAAVKKKIDDLAKSGFEPFNALVTARYSDKTENVRIVGIGKSTGYRRGSVFVDGKGYQRYQVTRDTPENRRLMAAWQNIREANNAAIEKLKKEIEAAARAIPVETPDGPAK